ncbi:MAG: hypothetical protein ACYC0O_01815 [Desulfurivibrionaceae bacterium]|jgi:hypothetical protein|nr:hypothetical protein [Pseudomonadota bacterium]MBU4229863.1 hypothetical protein [Pseudomonadota bacterium]MCG2823119.1 hypothetical protein [Desulfobulbaceae bacterium]MDP2003809.1 hypothetical protein [Desulfurivibrionaceae bacterium]MDP2756721.1 hypothetical protein [Desulfurivibrionaceae bacterium]
MDTRIEALLEAMKKLEQEVLEEIEKKEAEFYYRVVGRKVRFEAEVRKQHRALMQRVSRYLSEAPLLNILTVPFIWFILIPALFLDLSVTVFQVVCFRVYGIPRVKRRNYIVVDRQSLAYLNPIEKLNCMYCGYVNGLIAYVREIGGRTEQYWCPIKHARRIASMHSRYGKFLEYGDAEGYRNRLEEIRRDFRDLEGK